MAHDPDLDRDLVLLTNVPIRSAADARTVYTDWRYRPQIEHSYRFDQEDGLDVEDMRVRKLERMRRLFLLVLLAATFVYHLGLAWPEPAIWTAPHRLPYHAAMMVLLPGNRPDALLFDEVGPSNRLDLVHR